MGAVTATIALRAGSRPCRTGVAWNKNLVLEVFDEEAVAGAYWWGKRRDGAWRA